MGDKTHSLDDAVSHPLTHSLTPSSLTHPLTPSLPHSICLCLSSVHPQYAIPIPNLPSTKDPALDETIIDTAKRGDAEKVVALLKRGADPMAKDGVGDPKPHLSV